jgi:hypothetical protein
MRPASIEVADHLLKLERSLKDGFSVSGDGLQGPQILSSHGQKPESPRRSAGRCTDSEPYAVPRRISARMAASSGVGGTRFARAPGGTVYGGVKARRLVEQRGRCSASGKRNLFVVLMNNAELGGPDFLPASVP